MNNFHDGVKIIIGASAALFALIIGALFSLGGGTIPLMVVFYFLGHTIGPKILFELAQPSYKLYLVTGPIGLAFIKLVIKIFQADGSVKVNEIKKIKSYFVKEYGEEIGTATEDYAKSIVDTKESTYSLCHPLLKMKLSHRIIILQQLFIMAVTKGKCSKEREFELKKVAKFLHIGKKRFELIKLNLVNEATTKEKSNKSQQGKRTTGGSYKFFEQFFGPIYNPYIILGVENTASNDQVKKAYRELVKKFHPDLSMQKSDQYQEKIREKIQEINEAYETIKKLRGIK